MVHRSWHWCCHVLVAVFLLAGSFDRCCLSTFVFQKQAGEIQCAHPGLFRRMRPIAQVCRPLDLRRLVARASQTGEVRGRAAEFSGRPLPPPPPSPPTSLRSNRIREHAAQKPDNIALLIDGDQTGYSHLASIFDALQRFGRVVVGRTYISDPGRAASWNTSFQKFGVHPILLQNELFGMADTSKELVDKQIFWDAAMFAFNPDLALRLVGQSEQRI